jgi:UDP-glucose 4-epimerase
MNVLVTGGAGYIGSHILRVMARHGHTCVVLDNLCRGHAAAVGAATLVKADAADRAAVVAAMRQHQIDLVIHMAAFIEAGESVQQPDKYFSNNTLIGLAMLDAMREAGVKRIVFSSTAAVYGQPKRVPIKETQPLAPINPYGASKVCVEYMLQAYAAAYGLGGVALRYFNVAGADPDGTIGEAHNPETHLIPLVLQVPLGQRGGVKIFGNDYDTPDGTCIRDYIHVLDLAEAHRLAAAAIEPGIVKAYNLGSGSGFSVRQILDACRKVTGKSIPAEDAPRRAGDPAALIASSAKARKELRWRPQYSEIETIVAHAWNWHQRHPGGYGGK